MPILPPYPTEISLIDRRCRGKINTRLHGYGYTQTELFHEAPIGEPPYIEVKIKPLFSTYHYDNCDLVGFISPSIEFLGKQGTLNLLDSLGELFTTVEAAEMLKRSPRYLEKLRRQGEGPKFWRIAEGTFSYTVLYERCDIESYADERKVRPEKRGGRRNRSKQKVV